VTNIIRTKTKAHGGITPAEKALMDEHSKLWISRGMRTSPIDPDKIIPAIEGIYAAAGLKKPRVVIVPSPMVMAFAYGASAAIWYAQKNDATNAATRAATNDATNDATNAATRAATNAATYAATRAATNAATHAATNDATYAATRAATHAATNDATYAATRAATHAATNDATRAATNDATYAATNDATNDATNAATRAATNDATRAATYAATYAATHAATNAATRAATNAATHAATHAATYAATNAATRTGGGVDFEKLAAQACFELAGKLGIECAKNWWRSYQGGNMWAGYDCYLTACRDILGLELTSHAGYAFWEQAAIHGGFRVMHEEFCMVSDFPETLRVDDQNRPHCENGPSHRWRDGWSLYHWHGVKIPAEWIEDKASLTAKTALTWTNIEQRRAAIEIVGWARILRELNAKVIDADGDPQIGTLVEVKLPDLPRPARFCRVTCGTGREFAVGVPPEIETALAAQAWMQGVQLADFIRPEIRT
jgi:hypothetical protein